MNTTPRLHTQVFWFRRIETAVADPDPVKSNAAITTVHKELGQALGRLIPGPNFHTWAVWGSSKAGETIRGEGNEQAEQEVPLVAAMIGGLVGLLMAWPLAVVGVVFGWLTARCLIAIGTRRAAKQVLAGNRLVLADIGRVTARYLARFRFDRHFDVRKLADFLGSLPDDQHLLRTAFDCYHRARFETDSRERDRLVWEGNCLAVLHEHHKLQPYISGAMPWGLRRYVTARLLKYRVGSLQLKVSAPLLPARFDTTEPAVLEHLATTPVRAVNWADLHDRMRYVFALFAAYHSHPEVESQDQFNPSVICLPEIVCRIGGPTVREGARGFGGEVRATTKKAHRRSDPDGGLHEPLAPSLTVGPPIRHQVSGNFLLGGVSLHF